MTLLVVLCQLVVDIYKNSFTVLIMKTYKVDVYDNGDKHWYLNGKLHREDGPAVERADDSKSWYLNDEELSEAKFNARTKPTPSCEGKVVEIDGVKYKLVKA